MLVIPAFLPSTLAAYLVVGEREQGPLEPVLITPVRREKFPIGKALAAFIPTTVISRHGLWHPRRGPFCPSSDRLGDLRTHA